MSVAIPIYGARQCWQSHQWGWCREGEQLIVTLDDLVRAADEQSRSLADMLRDWIASAPPGQ